MADHLFISYSRIDGAEFALRLADELEAGPPPYRVWLDSRELQPGQDWDSQVIEAIQTCAALLFVMSDDSVRDESGCKAEWLGALKYKKPVIPVRMSPTADLPFRLSSRQFFDLSVRFESGLAQLRKHLRWIRTPAGVLQDLRERRADAEYELRRADPAQRGRIEVELEHLHRSIDEQQRLVRDPQAAREQAQARIASGLERERQPERPLATAQRAKFVNPPPMAAPGYFQDRHVETGLIGEFLTTEGLRLMSVVGRGGVGKTAIVCRLLKALEAGRLPDDLGEVPVDGIVYLSHVGAHGVNFRNLFTDLCRLLSPDVAEAQLERYRDLHETAAELMRGLLEAFPAGRTVILMDGFEDVLDAETFGITDPALDEGLRALLSAPAHGVKVILTTRVAPRSLMLVQPAAQRRLDVDAGLPSPYAEEILRARDQDGRLGLRDASDSLLAEARERTRGLPRALEALAALLAAEGGDTTLPQLLADTEGMPENVVETLVGEAFNRLDPLAQQVMQALAIYTVPVPTVAVDYLLQINQVATDSAPVVSRLVDMQFVRRDAGRYYLHRVDREYALHRLPPGEQSDRDADPPPFTQYALRARGADYFQQTRRPRDTWRTLDDLEPQLAEINLLLALPKYEEAAEILLDIDEALVSSGGPSVVADLHEKLQGRLQERRLRDASLAALRRARRLMEGDSPDRVASAAVELAATMRGHESRITRLAWLPDGKTLISASLDGTLRAWDVASGEETLVLRGHGDRVFDVAVTRDGSIAVSASADQTLKVWDLRTGDETRTLVGHRDLVSAVAVSPDGSTAVSGSWDRTLKVWDLTTGTERATLRGHADRINAVSVTHDGRSALSAAWDGTVRVWDLLTGEQEQLLDGGTGGDNDLAFAAQGNDVASAAEDGTVRVWELRTGRQLRVLEGPSSYVTGVSVSVDGLLLAAKSADGAVRLWRTDSWEPVYRIDEASPADSVFAGIAFSPEAALLATLGEEDAIIRVWHCQAERLLAARTGDAVRYATAKLVLVGDQGVGKTGLGWRLAHGDFKLLPSTHGQQFWLVDQWHSRRADGTDCEVVLWDFAGQPDYRLVHTLFLDDVDLALVLFDPSLSDPLGPVEYWIKHLLTSERRTPTILVAARIDVGAPTWTPDELAEWCKRHGVAGGYVATSAKTGIGIEALSSRIRAQISWDEKSPTITPQIFSTIKDIVLKLREESTNGDGIAAGEEASRLMSPEDLSHELAARGSGHDNEISLGTMMSAVKHLSKHGYVALLERSTGDQVILLRPHIINNLVASMVLEARRSNLGVLDEARLLAGDYPFPELATFASHEQATLLEAAAELSLRHHLCFRQALPEGTGLVFPSLINEKPPERLETDTVDGTSYVVTGAVETVYASLVVQLGHTNVFTRTNHWQNRAQYEVRPSGVCGFQQVQSHSGTTEFVLYFGSNTPQSARTLFHGLFESYLEDHDVAFSAHAPVVCPVCAYRQNRSEVLSRIRQGKTTIGCANACGTVIQIGNERPSMALTTHEEQQIQHEQTTSRVRTAFDISLTRFKATGRALPQHVAPRCFLSYAWGDPGDDGWVEQLAEDLENAGVRVVLDKWDNALPGESIIDFVEQLPSCDFAAVIGTPLYKQKTDDTQSPRGHILAAEARLIKERLMGSKQQRHSVLPLLRTGTIEESFTPMFWGITAVDFRDEGRYFDELLKLVSKMHGLSLRDESVIALRREVRDAVPRAGALSPA